MKPPMEIMTARGNPKNINPTKINTFFISDSPVGQ